MIIGSFEVSKNYLVDLITRFTKDKHLLIPSDLYLNDKMNYKSAEKMFSEMVQNLLKTQPDALGTVKYLNLMNKIKVAFLDKNVLIYCMWNVVFFLRIWRRWIISDENLSLSNNFITLNSYLCVELNIYVIIKLNNLFKENKQIDENTSKEMFLPLLFSSQPCEKLFRAVRSRHPLSQQLLILVC
ncbi:unnamed protein product [Psylliodes chrysocephalus]|uniref:Uncharacterized protein n=1 Tax=Psylliodes chrysocephalus TaxID=3402493 RepID=A0A9P0CVU7_9CUCU|nr:unnamed protein product [Psylliodes chrysocephala]